MDGNAVADMGLSAKEVAELVVTTTEKVLSKKLSDSDRNEFAQAAADGMAVNE